MRGLQSWEIWGTQRAHHVPGWPLHQLALGLPREQAVEMGNPAWPLVSSRSGFVNPGTTYILDQMVDVGLCPVYCIYQHPSLYPLYCSSIPQVDNQNVSRHCPISSGGRESARPLKTTALDKSLPQRTRGTLVRKKRNLDREKNQSHFKGTEICSYEERNDLPKITELSCPASL